MCRKLCGCYCVSLLLGTARALLWPAEAKALKALSSLAYANAGTVGQAVVPFVPLETRAGTEVCCLQDERVLPALSGTLGSWFTARLLASPAALWGLRLRAVRLHHSEGAETSV